MVNGNLRYLENKGFLQADEEDDLMEKRKRSRLDVAEEDFRSLLTRKLRSPLEFSWKETGRAGGEQRITQEKEFAVE